VYKNTRVTGADREIMKKSLLKDGVSVVKADLYNNDSKQINHIFYKTLFFYGFNPLFNIRPYIGKFF
jgi:hypothetical protein